MDRSRQNLIMPVMSLQVFFVFTVMSTIITLILSHKYFDNVIVTVNNIINLSLSSIFLGIISNNKWSYTMTQESRSWVFMISLKLIAIPVFRMFFTHYFINYSVNLVSGVIFTKILLNRHRFGYAITTGLTIGIIFGLIVTLLASNSQKAEYEKFLGDFLVEILCGFLQFIAVLFLVIYKKIENSIRINTLKNFHNIIAHEIFTPIAVIETQIGVLQTQDIERKMQDSLKSLNKTCRKIRKRMNFIMENVKLINTNPILNEVPISLIDVLRECTKDYLTENYRISILTHNDILFAGPKHALECIFYNLIDNAFLHGGINASLEIIVSEGYIIFQDSGGEIASTDAKYIFEIFTSTKEHNLGIGLTVAKEIVNNYGGTIKCISLKGKHTTFIINFPRQWNV